MFKILLVTFCFSAHSNELKQSIEKDFSLKEINSVKGLCDFYKENGGECHFRPDLDAQKEPEVPTISQIISQAIEDDK